MQDQHIRFRHNLILPDKRNKRYTKYTMTNHPKPLTVYKASAGSGKTFTLTKEYIKLVIKDPTCYRNILAVTFTNKATEEMKMRILSTLYGIWKQLPDSVDYLKQITKEIDVSPELASAQAGKALSLLVHNYNYFRVETIDTFFQSVLRNLARELDLTANLRIELNDYQVEDILQSINKPKYKYTNHPVKDKDIKHMLQYINGKDGFPVSTVIDLLENMEKINLDYTPGDIDINDLIEKFKNKHYSRLYTQEQTKPIFSLISKRFLPYITKEQSLQILFDNSDDDNCCNVVEKLYSKINENITKDDMQEYCFNKFFKPETINKIFKNKFNASYILNIGKNVDLSVINHFAELIQKNINESASIIYTFSEDKILKEDEMMVRAFFSA